jgi:hypothetical protein
MVRLGFLVGTVLLIYVLGKLGTGVPGSFDSDSSSVDTVQTVTKKRVPKKPKELPQELPEELDEGWVLVGKDGEASVIVDIGDAPKQSNSVGKQNEPIINEPHNELAHKLDFVESIFLDGMLADGWNFPDRLDCIIGIILLSVLVGTCYRLYKWVTERKRK